jgi:thiol-disulfide isomerase/thioredoxin
MRHPFLVSAVLAMSSTVGFAQSSPSTPSSDGLELLTRVTKQYADAKTYYIESVEERTTTSEYSHGWQKTVLTAAESPGNRFYYEGRSSSGRAMRVTDGKTIWSYRVDEHRYTVKQQPVDKSSQSKITPMTEFALMNAEELRETLGNLAKSLKSANRLPDATLKLDGHKISCNVIRVQTSDQKRVPSNYSYDKTIWIDKRNETIVRITESVHTYMMSGTARIPIDESVTTTFANTDLNGPVRESLFTFIPPSDASLIQDFPDPAKNFGNPDMTGMQAPSLKLKSADGKVVSLDSFRGKPVLIDFWATWCGPCIEALPQVAKIYQEAGDKGLVLLSVDQDEEAKTAADFWSKKSYAWPDFHDAGDIEKVMGASGIPRMVLINARGEIVFDATAPSDDQLRKEIAKLGPQYASLLAKPKQAPCACSEAGNAN